MQTYSKGAHARSRRWLGSGLVCGRAQIDKSEVTARSEYRKTLLSRGAPGQRHRHAWLNKLNIRAPVCFVGAGLQAGAARRATSAAGEDDVPARKTCGYPAQPGSRSQSMAVHLVRTLETRLLRACSLPCRTTLSLVATRVGSAWILPQPSPALRSPDKLPGARQVRHPRRPRSRLTGATLARTHTAWWSGTRPKRLHGLHTSMQ